MWDLHLTSWRQREEHLVPRWEDEKNVNFKSHQTFFPQFQTCGDLLSKHNISDLFIHRTKSEKQSTAFSLSQSLNDGEQAKEAALVFLGIRNLGAETITMPVSSV